ncbi:hypothetical protein [Draconibacterium orientale]|jgi:hypothetical protein|uniref:hypothetical protein n=1 Tax=Draconibacterium orientale TaxID=1168034 RepID=UPI002A0A603B|nr:hypothetical protein [Draconibacterium orientale]
MLRLLLFFISITTIISTVSAQKLKKRTEEYGDFKEVYHIDKATKFRCGESFVVKKTTKDTLAIGRYLNAARTGEWRFGDSKSGEDYMIFNYSNDSLIYLNQELVADSFLVRVGDTYEVKKVDRPLLYIGSKNEIVRLMGKDLEIPHEIMKEGKSGFSLLEYFVDEQGNLSGPKLISGFSREIEQSINHKLSRLSGEFLPAIVDGNPVASTFFVQVNIGLDKELFSDGKKAPSIWSTDKMPPYIFHIDINYSIQTRIRKVYIGTKVVTTTDEMR